MSAPTPPTVATLLWVALLGGLTPTMCLAQATPDPLLSIGPTANSGNRSRQALEDLGSRSRQALEGNSIRRPGGTPLPGGGGRRPGGTPLPGGNVDPHAGLWPDDCYPSADACRACHPQHYDEWRSSGHAYSAVSPMFQRFEQAMTELTEGSVGSFCVRCHLPVGIQLALPRTLSVLDAPPVVREGVTCIACHRIREHYGRTHGDRRIEPGSIHDPVGRGGRWDAGGPVPGGPGPGLARVLADPAGHKVKVHGGVTGPGQPIHAGSYFFEPLSNSEVCVSCHQVAVHPGIWLEIVHAQYRASPAAACGKTCVDCHMGAVPGKAEGYSSIHVAELAGKPYGEPRKHAYHGFWGPGYSIAHPGIFPHHPKANRFTPRQWLTFEHEAGWGKELFEKSRGKQQVFPAEWASVDDRIDARKIVDANLAAAMDKRGAAAMTMGGALTVSPPGLAGPPRVGQPLRVAFRVDNVSDGHNAPTGSLGAQPQVWLNAVLVDPAGRRVWESGYTDTAGDLADLQSADVATGRVPRDGQLFNLQTKFLINNVRGTDREVALPVNFSLDQIGLLRPGAVPVSVLHHPPLIRMEAHSIPPLDHRIARYTIPAAALSMPGTYRISVRMRSRPEPSYFMRLIGATPTMIRRMNAGIIDFSAASYPVVVR